MQQRLVAEGGSFFSQQRTAAKLLGDARESFMKLCGLLVGFLALDEAAVRSAIPCIFIRVAAILYRLGGCTQYLPSHLCFLFLFCFFEAEKRLCAFTSRLNSYAERKK